MIRTYTYKLYQNKNYQTKFDRWVGICRCVFNLAKETKDYAYLSHNRNLNKFDLINQLPELKEEFEWIKEVNSQTLQDVVERLDTSYQNYFRKLQDGEIPKSKQQYIHNKQKNGGKISYLKLKNFGKPKWAKKEYYNSFKFKQGIKQVEKGFKLPKFGIVKVFNNRKINGKIKQAQLVQKADGIYLHVTVEIEDKCINKYENQVGVDMGIKYFLVTSDGEYIDNPKFLEKQLKKLRVEQRSLSRKINGSKRRSKQVGKIKRLHKKLTDSRKDFLHKTSTYITVNNSDIAIEDLKISNMVKSKYARHISDVSWATFFEMLEYKSKNLVRVNPRYTSQECSNCGHTCKENRLTQSQFKCVSCGHEDNADLDAAKVILGRAFPNNRKRKPLG